MLKKNFKLETEILVQFIANSSKGASLAEIFVGLKNATPKRTLQYRLSKLVTIGVLRREGLHRNCRYYVNKQEKQPSNEMIAPSPTAFIPLSPEAKELQLQLSAPQQTRRHVSYKKEFLDSYEPNQTFYLTESIRNRLSKLGSGVEKGRPAGTYARKIYQRLLIDLSWNSSRLEGNTYSLLETEKLLETGEIAFGKDRKEAQMILNHKEAIEFIVDLSDELDIKRYIILNIHGLLSHDLLLDPKACGRLRTIPVKIGMSVYHPIEVPQLIEEAFQQIIYKAAMIKDPFEQSFFLMVHLPYLQPFLDVNKRLSRLAGNIPFIRDNLSPLSFVDVPEETYIQGLLAIYELNRIELFRDVFVWAYERSASLYLATLEAMGEPDPFRVRYRDHIRRIIYTIVHDKMDKTEAVRTIQNFASDNIPFPDRARFIEVAEIEILSLHEGNFARYRIRPSEFFDWQKYWK